jgi:hypothetical protein
MVPIVDSRINVDKLPSPIYSRDSSNDRSGMYMQNNAEGPMRERSGLVWHMLLQRVGLPEAGLVATWVDIVPGSTQKARHHPSAQVYDTGQLRPEE